jgi:hypothetical protein
MHNMAVHWYRYGDSCFKMLFNFRKGNHERVRINELVVEGKTLSVRNELARYIQEFYE